ncbi:MAG TPA: AsmA family protein [Hydrogenophaga sp.]|nr:AsmA family protein [Hydrogenophaga sp.]
MTTPTDTPSPPPSTAEQLRSAWGRRPVLWATGAVAGLLLVMVVWSEVAGWPFLRQPLERALSRGTAVPVQLQGDVKLHLIWRPRLEVEHLLIGSDARFKAPHLLDAERVSLAWRWGDVWRWRRGGTLHLQALRADVLDAHLVRTADGETNWQLGTDEPAPEPETSDKAALPSFGTLTVGQGQIAWVDAVQDADVAVKLHGSESSAASAPGAGYEATLTGRYRALPLKLAVRAGSTLPLLQDPNTATDAPWVPVRIEGTVAATRVLYDGQAASLLGTPRLQGTVEAAGPSLADVAEPLGLTLPRTPKFDVRGELQQDGGVWRLQTTRAHIGSSRLKGDLQYEQLTQPPRLTGTLTGPKLALADLGPAVGADGDAGADAPADAPSGRALPQRRFDLPSLKAMDADVQVAIEELDFGTEAMAPLRRLKTQVLLDDGALRLEALQAVVSGGQVKGMTALNSNARPAQWEARLDFEGIDMAGWIRGLRPDAAEGQAPPSTATAALESDRKKAHQGTDESVQAYITGELFGNMHLRGAGHSTAEILGSADGPLNFALREATMSYLITEAMGIDVAQALGVVITGDRPLALRCARFDLVARNGVIEPKLAVMDNVDSTLWITGKVSLRDESLDLRVVTRPKDWSLVSLRTPITVTGTMVDPTVGIEPKRLAGRVLGALALGAAVGPAAAILPLIEQGSKDGADPCNPNLASASPAAKPSAPSSPSPPKPKKP